MINKIQKLSRPLYKINETLSPQKSDFNLFSVYFCRSSLGLNLNKLNHKNNNVLTDDSVVGFLFLLRSSSLIRQFKCSNVRIIKPK